MELQQQLIKNLRLLAIAAIALIQVNTQDPRGHHTLQLPIHIGAVEVAEYHLLGMRTVLG